MPEVLYYMGRDWQASFNLAQCHPVLKGHRSQGALVLNFALNLVTDGTHFAASVEDGLGYVDTQLHVGDRNTEAMFTPTRARNTDVLFRVKGILEGFGRLRQKVVKANRRLHEDALAKGLASLRIDWIGSDPAIVTSLRDGRVVVSLGGKTMLQEGREEALLVELQRVQLAADNELLQRTFQDTRNGRRIERNARIERPRKWW